MRVIVAEDTLLIREGLARVLATLGHELVGAVERADEIPQLIAQYRPDVAILDIKTPPTYTDEGLRMAAHVRTTWPDVAVLVLSQYVVPSYATFLLRGGPSHVGYLLKEQLIHPETLDVAIHRIAAGGVVVDPQVVIALLAARRAAEQLARLTNRERDILRLIAEGLTDRGIAERLHLTLHTIDTHVRSILAKLDLARSPTDNRRVLAVLKFLEVGRS